MIEWQKYPVVQYWATLSGEDDAFGDGVTLNISEYDKDNEVFVKAWISYENAEVTIDDRKRPEGSLDDYFREAKKLAEEWIKSLAAWRKRLSKLL